MHAFPTASERKLNPVSMIMTGLLMSTGALKLQQILYLRICFIYSADSRTALETTKFFKIKGLNLKGNNISPYSKSSVATIYLYDWLPME